MGHLLDHFQFHLRPQLRSEKEHKNKLIIMFDSIIIDQTNRKYNYSFQPLSSPLHSALSRSPLSPHTGNLRVHSHLGTHLACFGWQKSSSWNLKIIMFDSMIIDQTNRKYNYSFQPLSSPLHSALSRSPLSPHTGNLRVHSHLGTHLACFGWQKSSSWNLKIIMFDSIIIDQTNRKYNYSFQPLSSPLHSALSRSPLSPHTGNLRVHSHLGTHLACFGWQKSSSWNLKTDKSCPLSSWRIEKKWWFHLKSPWTMGATWTSRTSRPVSASCHFFFPPPAPL